MEKRIKARQLFKARQFFNMTQSFCPDKENAHSVMVWHRKSFRNERRKTKWTQQKNRKAGKDTVLGEVLLACAPIYSSEILAWDIKDHVTERNRENELLYRRFLTTFKPGVTESR